MFGGDQGKGYMDHGKDWPIDDPKLAVLYTGMGLVLVAALVTAVFQWTWIALVVFIVVGSIATYGVIRVRAQQDKPPAPSEPQPGNHPPLDYR